METEKTEVPEVIKTIQEGVPDFVTVSDGEIVAFLRIAVPSVVSEAEMRLTIAHQARKIQELTTRQEEDDNGRED